MMMNDVKIDIDAAGGVDLDRLGRSLLLHGERVGDGRYHIVGGEHDHWVDLTPPRIRAATAVIICGAIGSASTSSPRCCARGTSASSRHSASCSAARSRAA